MRVKNFLIIFASAMLVVASSCTPRRTDSAPEADGDTIEVVIPDKNQPR